MTKDKAKKADDHACQCCGTNDCTDCGPVCKCGCLLICDGCTKCCCCCSCESENSGA
jgi:hypothetical protein